MNPLIQNSVQQNYLPELSLWTFMGNPMGGGQYQRIAKTLLIFPIWKILANKFTPSTIKNVIPSPIK